MLHLSYHSPLAQLVVMISWDGCQHDEITGIILTVTDQKKDQGSLTSVFLNWIILWLSSIIEICVNYLYYKCCNSLFIKTDSIFLPLCKHE